MELDEIFGLPAHPLVVHAAVVLLPLAAIGTIVVALVPRARRHYGPVVLGTALVATLFVILAGGSGEALEEKVSETPLLEDHTHKAESVLPWAIATTVMAAGVTFAEPIRERVPRIDARQATAALAVGALIAGTGATWSIVTVGHSGAKAAWDDVSSGGSEHAPASRSTGTSTSDGDHDDD